MPWFKVDDKLHDHPKTRKAGHEAMGLWVLAGSYSGGNLTDGFVPEHTLTRWVPTLAKGRRLAEKLVTAGLWFPDVQDDEKGWRFHEWSERQPTKAQKEHESKVRAEAGRSGGQASGRARREAKSKQGASSNLVEPPTRPDPTTAAAAADDAAAAADLPTAIDILRSKLQAVTALRALRFDRLRPDTIADLERLIAVHGDQVLVDVAIRTCRTPPPVHVSAFLGTWAALPEPGQRLKLVTPAELCEIHPAQGDRADRCRYCAADKLAGDA